MVQLKINWANLLFIKLGSEMLQFINMEETFEILTIDSPVYFPFPLSFRLGLNPKVLAIELGTSKLNP